MENSTDFQVAYTGNRRRATGPYAFPFPFLLCIRLLRGAIWSRLWVLCPTGRTYHYDLLHPLRQTTLKPNDHNLPLHDPRRPRFQSTSVHHTHLHCFLHIYLPAGVSVSESLYGLWKLTIRVHRMCPSPKTQRSHDFSETPLPEGDLPHTLLCYWWRTVHITRVYRERKKKKNGGELDFFLPCPHLGRDLVRDGHNIDEHMNRFQTNTICF